MTPGTVNLMAEANHPTIPTLNAHPLHLVSHHPFPRAPWFLEEMSKGWKGDVTMVMIC